MAETLETLRRKVAELLLRNGVTETPLLDTDRLFCALLGYSRAEIWSRSRELLDEVHVARILYMARRRAGGEPLAYVLGEAGFYGRSFAVNPGCLVPRPETEILVEEALKRLPERGTFLDWGTGSGCIAATLLLECPTARGFALEASPRAVVMAWHNFRRHGLLPAVTLLHSSTCDALPSACMDMVLGNPPYIPTAQIPFLMREVRDFEPHSALDGGVDGLDAYRFLLPVASRLLRPGGWLLLEIGGEEQVAPLRDLEDGLVFCGSRPDLNGHIRVLLWRKGEKMA